MFRFGASRVMLLMLQLTPTITDHCMSTNPSFLSESIFWMGHRVCVKFGMGTSPAQTKIAICS